MSENVTQSRITFQASPEIHDVISCIGRTEDIRLSPDNQRLAVLDFQANKVYMFGIRIINESRNPKVTILDYSIISSAAFSQPHGITYLGNNHFAVCNRSANVDVFSIPPPNTGRHEFDLTPLQSINGKGFLFARVKTPGSLDACRIAENHYRVLVCNNHWHFVTSHTIETGDSVRIRNNGILLESSLKVPDGICYSADGKWIAISNHACGEVLVYENTSGLDKGTPPAAKLGGLVCPHGIRFAPAGDRIFVADAASQYLHVFDSKCGRWEGTRVPSKSIRMLDDRSFYAGRYAAREGGLKGVDTDLSGSILVSTRKDDAIAFYDLGQLLEKSSSVDRSEISEFCRERDLSFELNQRDILERHWNLRTRLRYEIARFGKLLRYVDRTRIFLKQCYLSSRNEWTNQSILEPSGPILSLTTYGHRLPLVFLAIESIAVGKIKPSRFILWLEDEDKTLNPPETLQRLVSRGLEIKHAEALGPHTKYYPYIDRERELRVPLVTADDDILYPRDWLQKLVNANEADPTAIHCHRAHRIGFSGKRLSPYNEWGPCTSRSPSHLNFLTGVGGVIYPPDFQNHLKRQGKAFLHCCPTADDIWLTVNALRAGFKIAQVDDVHFQSRFDVIPHTQKRALMRANLIAGGNQFQLVRTMSVRDIAILQRFALSGTNASEIAAAS